MSRALHRLLADVLERQVDMSEPGALEERVPDWADILRRGGQFSAADRELLWRSPEARERLTDIRRGMARDAADAWRRRGFSTELAALAADSGGDSRVVEGSGFSLRMYRSPARGHWTVSLLVDAEALALVPEGLSIRLADSGGLVWLEGPLDRTGGLDAYWADEAESPIERLRDHTLALDFC